MPLQWNNGDENKSGIESFECLDCATPFGEYKPNLAVSMWSNRGSGKQAHTEVKSSWRKSTVYIVGTNLKLVTFEQLYKTFDPLRVFLGCIPFCTKSSMICSSLCVVKGASSIDN